MAVDLEYLITFPDPAADLPARIVHAAADAVRENWQAPDHGGPPVPRRVLPAKDLAEAWSQPEWPDHSEFWKGRPETVRVEFEFSPFTYYPMRLNLYRWPGRLQAIVSLYEKAFYGAFEGSYFFQRVKAAGHADPDRWGDVEARYRSMAWLEIDVPDRNPDLMRHLDAVVFAVAGAGPSEGPEDVGDAHPPPTSVPTRGSHPPRRRRQTGRPSTTGPRWKRSCARAETRATKTRRRRAGSEISPPPPPVFGTHRYPNLTQYP